MERNHDVNFYKRRSSVTGPVKKSKGFKEIGLEPGQSQVVSFIITPELLSFCDKDMKWIIEPGDLTTMVEQHLIKLKV